MTRSSLALAKNKPGDSNTVQCLQDENRRKWLDNRIDKVRPGSLKDRDYYSRMSDRFMKNQGLVFGAGGLDILFLMMHKMANE